jgi:hypothetical protein
LVKSAAAVRQNVSHPLEQYPKGTAVKTFIKFLAAGVPGLVIAFSGNIFFVEILKWSKPVAYAVVGVATTYVGLCAVQAVCL